MPDCSSPVAVIDTRYVPCTRMQILWQLTHMPRISTRPSAVRKQWPKPLATIAGKLGELLRGGKCENTLRRPAGRSSRLGKYPVPENFPIHC